MSAKTCWQYKIKETEVIGSLVFQIKLLLT